MAKNEEAVFSEIGRMLRDRREELGLSTTEVAARSGLGQSTIEAYEAGTREPGYSSLLSVCRALLIEDLNVLKRATYDDEVKTMKALHADIARFQLRAVNRRGRKGKGLAPGPNALSQAPEASGGSPAAQNKLRPAGAMRKEAKKLPS